MALIDTAKANQIDESHLLTMRTNKTVELGNVSILKVMGGWIYYTYGPDIDISAVFVPEPEEKKNSIV